MMERALVVEESAPRIPTISNEGSEFKDTRQAQNARCLLENFFMDIAQNDADVSYDFSPREEEVYLFGFSDGMKALQAALGNI